MGQRLGGVAYLKGDGQTIPLRGALTVHPQQTKRTGVAGQDGPQGFTEMPVCPSIEADVSCDPGYSIAAALAMTNATVQAELANGMVYVLRGAWVAEEVSVDTVEGKAKFTWQGLSMDEFASNG